MDNNNENQNYTDVLLEKIDSKFDFLVEESKTVKEKLGSLEEKVDGLAQDVELLKEDMDQVKSDIYDMKKDIKEIRGDISDINGKLDKKADKEVVSDHENRLVELENLALAKQ